MQIHGWDKSGTIELWDMTCNDNKAAEYGGCLDTGGRGLLTNGTVMNGNVAYLGGCICKFRSISVRRAIIVKLQQSSKLTDELFFTVVPAVVVHPSSTTTLDFMFAVGIPFAFCFGNVWYNDARYAHR